MHQNPHVLRILDANANRAREALRVMEDYARFALNDQALSLSLKQIRHRLADALRPFDSAAILHRDTALDVGRENKTPQETTRENLASIVIAAGKRLSEALRALEEAAKTLSPPTAAQLKTAALLEALRYEGYIHEQTLARAAQQQNRFRANGVYVLLTESLCELPWEQTLHAVLKGGASCVQLREKNLEAAELLSRARIVANACRQNNATSIINDRPDIARLANADGVHLGQTDLPCESVRQLVGPDLLIGVSTENLTQARAALLAGASYIGVGPMFPTTTKEKPRLAGPAYAAEAIREIPLPAVAIGGITLGNLPQLRAANVSTIAVCSAIISSPDPEFATRQLAQALQEKPNA